MSLDASFCRVHVFTEVMDATFQQDLDRLEYLWTRGASIDCHDETNGYTPLHWFSHRGLDVLMTPHFDQLCFSFYRAIINDKMRSTAWLLKHDVKVNEQDSLGWTPLHYSVHNNKVQCTQALIDRGASPFVKNNKGKIPGSLYALFLLLQDVNGSLGTQRTCAKTRTYRRCLKLRETKKKEVIGYLYLD